MSLPAFFRKLLVPVRMKKSDLGRVLSGPTASGARQAISGHPASGITPRRLASLLRRAEEGDEIPYLELAEEMEEKDCHYRAVLSTRKLQVAGLQLSVEAFSEKPEDVEAADLCREIFPVLRPALFDIMDAVGKGFSVSEIIWDLSGRLWKPASIEWRDPRWFGFEPLTGSGPFLRDESGMLQPLAPCKFIVHRVRSKSGQPVRGGLARVAAWAWLFKNYDLKAWNTFCEVYGHPLRLGKYDAAASREDRETLLRAVREIGADHAAIIPADMSVDFIDAKAQGNAQVFRELAEYLDMQLSKLVLGQTGTTDTGSRVGTAEAHERVRADIEAADADALCATLNRDLLTPLIRLNFGETRAIPVLSLKRDDKENLSELAENLVRLAPIAPDLVEVSVIRDKFGFPEPARGAACIGSSLPSPDPGGSASAVLPERRSRSLPAKDEKDAKDAEAVEAGEAAKAPVSLDANWPDELADEMLDGWRPVDFLRERLEELAASSASHEDFAAGLASLAADLDDRELRGLLASGIFAARFIGRNGASHA